MTDKKKDTGVVARETAEKSKIPLLPNLRSFGFIDHSTVATAGSVATWLFLTGAWIGMAVPVAVGMINVIFATLIGIIPIAIMGWYFSRWGVEHSIGFAPTFGTLGTRILMIFLFLPIYWLWTSIPPVMFGRAVSQSAELMGAQPSFWTNPVLWGIVVLLVGWWVAYSGSAAVKWFARIAVPAMIILIILIAWQMFSFYGVDKIFAYVPAEGFHPEPYLSFMIAVEISIAVGISWVGNAAEYTRMTKSEPNAFWGIVIAWAIMWGILCIPGLIAGAMAGASDPVVVLASIGGGQWAIVYLALLALANPTSVVMEIFMIALMLMGIFPRIKWIWATAISIPVTLFFIFFPWAYDSYGGFVTVSAAVLAPIAGTWIASIIITKAKLNLKEALDWSKHSAYRFYGGINIWAFIAVAAGTLCTLLIYNPLTMAIHFEPVFRILGASIPGLLTSLIVYLILSYIFLIPKKIGLPAIPEAE